jgi:aspartate kinase
MRVFKFGGASVKDAEGIKTYMTFYKSRLWGCVLVVSAMGKTTNALEVVIKDYFDKSAALQSSVKR